MFLIEFDILQGLNGSDLLPLIAYKLHFVRNYLG